MTVYFRYHLAFDVIVSMAASLIFYFLAPQIDLGFAWPSLAERTAFLSALMGASISLLGFVIAASSFLVSHLQHERFALVRSSKSWSQFISLTKSSLWRLLILAVYSGACIFVIPDYYSLWAVGLIFLSSLTVAALSALIWAVTAIFAVPLDVARK